MVDRVGELGGAGRVANACSKVALTGDGSHVVLRDTRGLHVLQVARSAEPIVIPAPSVADFAIVGNDLWLVDGTDGVMLRRYTLGGTAIGKPTMLWGDASSARLVTAPSGACAIWTAPPLAVVGVPDDSAPRVIPGEPELALPVSPTRWIACQRGQVAFRESTSERWRSDVIISKAHSVIDGAVLFDATCAALVTDATAAQSNGKSVRQLVVFGLREPVVQHRFTLADADTVRFARGRGYGLALIARRRLVLLDLRFGTVIAEHALDHDISDLAIDDGGQQIAVCCGDTIDDVVVLAVRDLAVAAASSTRSERNQPTEANLELANDGDAQHEPDEPACALGSDPAIPVASFDNGPVADSSPPDTFAITLGSVAALAPRTQVPPATRVEALALLDAYRELIGALAERAIALAWDEGRLAVADGQQPPFRAEVRGIRGRSKGIARTDLDEAAASVAAAVVRLSAAEAALSGRVSPLGRLAAELKLSTTAYRILLVVAAPALWGDLARLYAILTNDVARPLCDELLVTKLLGPHATSHDIARELDADAPLVRQGLLRLGTGARPFAALTVEPVVLQLLRGIDAAATIRDVRVVDTVVPFEQLLLAREAKARICAALAAPPLVTPRLVVRGRTGSGRHTLLATLAAASGRRLGVIDATPILRDLANRAHELRESMQRALLLGLLPCIDGLETIASDDPTARERVREILRDHPGPLAVRLPRDSQPPLDPGYFAIDLPQLSIGERLAAWNVALAAHGLDVGEPLALATRYSAGPGAITRACRVVARACSSARSAEPEMVDASMQQGGPTRAAEPTADVSLQLEAALRQHMETRLGATAIRVERLATWSQVMLPSDIQDSLTELIARFKHRRTVYETWHYDRVVTTSRGIVALFAGGPGTGKTMVAGAIANDLGVDLYRVDLSRILSKWIGETEQNLARLFDAAEDSHAIILFDEADSLFAKRTKVQTSVDRYANLEVNYLLQRLDSFEGIAILTTNFGSAIDRAFSRRLSVRITFPFPDEETREKLWKAHLPKELPTAGKIDFAGLARRFRLSGGYIRNAALRAAFLAAEEHTPLTQDHLERAIRAEFREIGQLSESSVLE